MKARSSNFVFALFLGQIAFAQNIVDPSGWPTPTLEQLEGVWVGGDDSSEFLRLEFAANGSGIAVGTVNGEKVNLLISDLSRGPLQLKAEFKAPPPSKSFHVFGVVTKSTLFLTLNDGEVNWKREFRLRRQDALESDIAGTLKQAEEFKRNRR